MQKVKRPPKLIYSVLDLSNIIIVNLAHAVYTNSYLIDTTCNVTSLCVISEELQAVRNMTFCRECGRRLFRSGGNCRSDKWDCHNPECSRFEYRITDNMLIGTIMNVLNTVIANPDLIEDDTSIGTYAPTERYIVSRMRSTV